MEINPNDLIKRGKNTENKKDQMGETVILQHITDRELETKIQIKNKITEGGLSNIYNAEILIGDKKIPFILKEYNTKNPPVAKKQAENAFKNYKKAKEMGLKVFNTFRLIKDSNKILMTNGFSSDTTCVSSNGLGKRTTVESFGHKRLTHLENFDELIDGILKETEKATSKELILDNDSYLFLINTNKNTADFVIGDMDFIKEIEIEDWEKGNAYLENKQGAYRALWDLITYNIINPDNLLKRLEDKFKKNQ